MDQHIDYIDVEQGSDEWRKARVGIITGSNVGAILGHNPYRSANAVLKTMVQEAKGHFKNLDHVPAIRWGNENEAVAAGHYTMEEAPSWNVTKAGFVTLNDWLGASPDRYVEPDGLLEIKCPASQALEPEPSFNSVHVQEHYYDQIQLQMLVTGRKWTDFYQWAPNGTLCERVVFDNEWFETHRRTLEDFYDKYTEALKDPAQYLDDDMLLPAFDADDMEVLAKEYSELKPLYDDIKGRLDKVEKAIKERVTASSQGYGICVRTSEAKGSIDYKAAMNQLHPEVTAGDLEPFRRDSNTRKSIRFIE